MGTQFIKLKYDNNSIGGGEIKLCRAKFLKNENWK